MVEIVRFEPPDTVVVKFKGKVVADDVVGMLAKWNNQAIPSQKIKVLSDMSELEDIQPAAREAFRKTSGFPISKLAAFGASTKIRMMAVLILKMIPNLDEAIYVDTEEEARAWLGEEK